MIISFVLKNEDSDKDLEIIDEIGTELDDIGQDDDNLQTIEVDKEKEEKEILNRIVLRRKQQKQNVLPTNVENNKSDEQAIADFRNSNFIIILFYFYYLKFFLLIFKINRF